jgi:uncharacterized protein (DUF58 family)
MLSSRGRRTVALGILLYLVSWGFGTPELFPVAIGLILAPTLAWLWVRLIARPMVLRRRTGHREMVEGGEIAVGLEVRPDGGPLPGRARVVDKLGVLGERVAEVQREGHALRGGYVISSAPRGRYTLHGAELTIDDPFGLAESRIPLERSDTVLVYPRVYQLDGLFTDAGAAGGDEGRALLHRTAGYDLHSIRDFQAGESLRRVHWRSTAKRRKLMVKEMTETPRDEAAVVLDCDAASVAGAIGNSSFDAQVRAAASLLARMVDSGHRCSLVMHGARRVRLRIQVGGAEWSTVMASLAAVRADADRPLESMLREVVSASGAADAVDAARVFVVTGVMSGPLAERLIALRSARRDVAVVWVEAPSFAGVQTVPGPATGASLRLARAGIPVAILRAGDSVSEVLSARHLEAASHA